MNMSVVLGGLLNSSDNYDYVDYEYEEPVPEPEPVDVKAVWIPLLYSVMFAVGVLGNGLILATLARRRRSWRVSDTFILHLSLADILLLLILPIFAALATRSCEWCFQGFVCKITGAVFNISFYCGILLLVCITRDRYLSIVHDTQLYSQKRPRFAHISCYAVWLISLILSIPDWIFLVAKKDSTPGKTLCVHKYSELAIRWQLISPLLHHILGFLLPAAFLIFYCSSILLHCSWKSLQGRRFILITLPLVVVFLLCWMPYNITFIINTIKVNSKKASKGLSGGTESSPNTSLTLTSAVGCAHVCIRPLLYLVLCRNFRRRSHVMLKCGAVESESSLWELGVGEEALPDPVQEGEQMDQLTSGDHKCSQAGADE